MPLTFNNPKKASAPPKEPVVAAVDPPTPIAELKIPHRTQQSKTLREVAKSYSIDNWGVWQYDGETTWSTIHKDSTPTAPRVNCSVVQAITVSKPLFEASPACKSFTVTTSDGQVLTMADLENVEWTAVEDLADEPEPDKLEELEDQINELQSDKTSILERLDALEAVVKTLGKRKSVAVEDDDDDDVVIKTEPEPPATASSSRMRRARK